VQEGDRAATIEALLRRVLPPLVDRKGVTGVHLCLADDSVSKVETAEKKARADTTQVPTWITLIEGSAIAHVQAAGDLLGAALGPYPVVPGTGLVSSSYQLEYTRGKTPWSAG
jgi:hypothetical protein